MKNLLKLLLLLLFTPIYLNAQSDCSHGEAITDLDFNNITARLSHSGSLWRNGFPGRYFAKPAVGESEVQAIRAGGLWLGGTHTDGSVRVAATTYGQGVGKTDFFPGPIRSATGTVEPEDCTNWDKHFKILRSEINSHSFDYAADNQVDNLNNAIYSWPGKDNPHSLEFNGYELPAGQDLAPFVDTNGDNIYNPNDGDYPDIKGDQAIWWVFNDIGNVHTSSNGLPIHIEVQAMGYTYQSFEPAIDNTTFYDFKLKYYGEETLENFQAALWMDVNLGCGSDDRLGIDTTKNMAYYYNADFVDGQSFDLCAGGVETYGMEIPMLGVKLLEDSEDLGVTSFICYVSALGSPPGGITSPATALEYYNYMLGLWRDGSQLTNEGDGYGFNVGNSTNYIFHGNPSIESEWSLCSAASQNNPQYDLKTIMSSGGNSLNPGDTRELTYAVIFVPNVPHPCPDLTDICAAADIVQEFDGMTSAISSENKLDEFELKIFPNPAQEQFTISVLQNEAKIERVELSDISGRILLQRKNINANIHTINRSSLHKGIYFLKVTTTTGKMRTEKVILN